MRARDSATVGGTDARGSAVLSALGDDDCRRLLSLVAREPMTVAELSQACDLPRSTVYRKLDRLTSERLVEEHAQVATSGRHANQYTCRVDDVEVDVGEAGTLDVSLKWR